MGEDEGKILGERVYFFYFITISLSIAALYLDKNNKLGMRASRYFYAAESYLDNLFIPAKVMKC